MLPLLRMHFCAFSATGAVLTGLSLKVASRDKLVPLWCELDGGRSYLCEYCKYVFYVLVTFLELFIFITVFFNLQSRNHM